jgi:Flp pilus assembly protein CpaB
MSALLLRLVILVLALALIGALVWAGRLFVARQKRLALTAGPDAASSPGKVRILAFSSADCTQCHTLQEPALRRLQALRGEEIDVVEIDATNAPDLTRRYRILTVPSTVILAPSGEAQAINYGFANLHKLQTQIDAVLASA